MTFNTITNSIKNKIENIQKADQKKNLKIKDITLIPEFEKLLANVHNWKDFLKAKSRSKSIEHGMSR